MAFKKKGDILKDYELISDVQNKNSGTACFAFAEKNNKEYFIKQFLYPKAPSVLCEDIERARRLKECQSFQEQKEILLKDLTSLKDNSLVLPHDFFLDNNSFYMVYPFLKQEPFEILFSLSLQERLKILTPLMHSFKAFHDLGWVHGDIKAENILIQKKLLDDGDNIFTYEAFIIDLDSCYKAGSMPLELVGDPRFIAPEVILYEDSIIKDISMISTKNDSFSLGILVLYILNGFIIKNSDGLTAAQTLLARKPLEWELPEELGVEWNTIIANLLHINYKKRSSLDELCKILESYAPAVKDMPSSRPLSPLKLNSYNLTIESSHFALLKQSLTLVSDIRFLKRAFTLQDDSSYIFNHSIENLQIFQNILIKNNLKKDAFLKFLNTNDLSLMTEVQDFSNSNLKNTVLLGESKLKKSIKKAKTHINLFFMEE